jgi:transcriptional regulator with XRE-family HTH domain
MPTKEELGRRLRIARFERNLTLKEVANRCGMSATHISEVERGKTSPTIGALQRIAAALEERTSYFVREEKIPSVLLTKSGERPDFFLTDAEGQPMATQIISKGLPRGTLQLFSKRMSAGDRSAGREVTAEAVFICRRGTTRITVAGESHVLNEGDTLQARLDDGYTAENIGDEENEVMLVVAAPVLVQA